MPEFLKAIILGIVEGLTEFLPISSTGHLILCNYSMGISKDDPFWKMFIIFIQIGAIAAVVVMFRTRIMELLRPARRKTSATPIEIAIAAKAAPATVLSSGPGEDVSNDEVGSASAAPGRVLMLIALATFPVLIVGFLSHKWVEAHLEKPRIVAAVLVIGGLLIALIEFLKPNVTTRNLESITWKQALGIGCAQILAAVFPGTSRSAATIMAGLVGGLSRPVAAEFSFYLAIPAMGAACAFTLLKWIKDPAAHVDTAHILLLVIGTLVSFLVAWVVIAAFMGFIRKFSFMPFAIYRILFGALVFLVVR